MIPSSSLPISHRRLYHVDVPPTYDEIKVLDGMTILFNNVHGVAQGFAKAIYPDYTIEFKYDRDVKQGPALIVFSDGTRIYFRYKDDLANGPAFEISPDGSVKNFIYDNGVSL